MRRLFEIVGVVVGVTVGVIIAIFKWVSNIYRQVKEGYDSAKGR